MCGIVGIARLRERVDQSMLEHLGQTLTHRGPDHLGFHVEHNPSLSIGLGSQRLSIIDLSEAGHQPMSNETGDIWICYNGELYNHQELRRELEAKGHIYRSRTDTETIIHAYEEYGIEGLSRFDGMFAFALYDRTRQKLFLARDRMGIKPLYYMWDGNTLLFASELKSLLANSIAPRALNPLALSLYLSLGYVPAPYSMCEGISKLSSGSYMLIQDGAISLQTYWVPQITSSHIDCREEDELVANTRLVMERAVQRQLMSDVPVGVFLSGGIDSTVVTALAQQFHEGPLDTFTVGFANGKGEVNAAAIENLDFFYARQIAKQLGTRHHECVFQEGPELIELLRKAIFYLDEPFWETSFLSLALMSRTARENGVIVVLTGDGGDELFAGYPWYLHARHLEMYEKIPVLKYALPLLARDRRRRFGQTDRIKYRIVHELFGAREKRGLIGQEIRERISADPVDMMLDSIMEQCDIDSFSERLALADLTLWVREHFNHRVDRMSMWNSVEARVPFQDNEVVEFALNISMDHKIRGSKEKYLLRSAFQELLPSAVLERKKRPFATPTCSWLRGPLRQFIAEVLSEKSIREFGFLEPEMVNAITTKFMAGEDRLFMKVWLLLNFQLWCQTYMRSTK